MADFTSINWFDGHLDLAYLGVQDRKMTADDPTKAGGPHQPASLTFPSLKAGGVSGAFGTIFTEPDGEGPCAYPADDVGAASHAGLLQLEQYIAWEMQGHIRIIRTAAELNEPVAEADGRGMRIVLLMEGGDPIRDPDDVAHWYQCGVRAVGLAWARGTRYTGGNGHPGPLTDLGRILVKALDEVGIIHDFSHLPDEASRGLLDLTSGPIMASHSNCRELIDGKDQRHLPDWLIEEIGKRAGMIGINLCSPFLSPKVTRETPAEVQDIFPHIERICDLQGRRDLVGLGSDMDGGFSAKHLPRGIDQPRDLVCISEGLAERGWSADEIAGFTHGNWERFLSRSLPR